MLRDHWYVAALSSEVSSRPLSRQILGEHVALYRTESGVAVALADRCPHRGYPLSLGTVVGETLVCGYHGFTFDCEGVCVEVPGQDRIPGRADARRYALVEQGPWIWIWTGHHVPDYDKLPSVSCMTDTEGWTSIAGMATIDARFDFLVDNLLDLSHETYLHRGSIGTPEVSTTPIEVESDDDEGVVRVYRHMNAVECPPFYSRTTGLEGSVDRWQDIEYFPPAFYQLHSRIAPVGEPPHPDGQDDHAFHMEIFYGLTPASSGRVHDFWALSRDFCRNDSDVDDFLMKMQTTVVQEDVDALNVLERRAREDVEPTEVSIKIDKGGLAARRLLRALADVPDAPGPLRGVSN
ncbi:MAG TPA: aromatic ring-hydroxylating dioxygenase subunit alpha [Acidimicrobiales bacterium]|nr:aromatic ring-hydroxylating dioxygenase subunit alpha [Acidimicrobiales bacterium]